MKPTNIFSTVENYKKYNSSKSDGSSKKSAKKITTSGIIGGEIGGKMQFANREDKSLSLSVILKREFDY